MTDNIRWGILGTADIASEMVRAIHASNNGQAVAVASRTAERAGTWAAAHGIKTSFKTYDDLLSARDQVDAIYLPLPNSLHAEWTIRALDAGFSVLCEKPLVTSLTEAEQVCKKARATGLLVAEGYMYRHHPLLIRTLELLRDGAIGDIASLDLEFTFLNDDPDALPAAAELGGGALMDVGCYCIHMARWVAGAEPLRVSAHARFEGNLDKTIVGILDFENGPIARIEASIAAAERQRVLIGGSQASLVLDRPWVQGLEPTTIRIQRWQQTDEIIEVPGADAYRLQVEAFADACLGRAEFPWPIEDAVGNTSVINSLVVAARERRSVEISS
ncbi:MAG: Gfo/Idh/MocA family oxidoreductase [Deltaproteobacteria bacterium]|nr:Gfo/Idh/MocA family oxidoreductase [Deltaproteobacteria bacterium]